MQGSLTQISFVLHFIEGVWGSQMTENAKGQ